jgi:sugar phosphate isomerase/epimerase
MTRKFGLVPLTAIELTPPQLVDVAVRAGYDAISLRLSPFRAGEAQHPMLITGGIKPPMLVETEQRLQDSGLELLDVEVMLLTAERDVHDFEPVFEVAAMLEARHALTLIDIADESLAAEKYAALCALAAPFGLNCALEFTAWIGVNSVQKAARIVERTGRRNGALLLDPFHLFRSGGTLADIANLDPKWLRYAQFCDAPATAPLTLAEISEEARFERLMPGDGGLPLVDFLRLLPPAAPLGLEIPMRRLSAEMGTEERLHRALLAAKRVAGLADS